MKRALLVGLLLLASFPASAHHSTTAEFDVTHRMTLAGTLTKVDWVNPHIVVFMDREGDGTLEVREQSAGVVPARRRHPR